MASREQLIQELETLAEELIDEVLDYIGFIKNRQPKNLIKVSFSDEWWDNLFRFTPDFLEEQNQPQLPRYFCLILTSAFIFLRRSLTG